MNEERLNVTKDKRSILVGLRNREDGLYDIPIPTNRINKLQKNETRYNINEITMKTLNA